MTQKNTNNQSAKQTKELHRKTNQKNKFQVNAMCNATLKNT